MAVTWPDGSVTGSLSREDNPPAAAVPVEPVPETQIEPVQPAKKPKGA